MTLQVGEFVRVFINGTERTEYVVSYSRKDSLCELGSTFTIELDPSLPSVPDPYDAIRIQEYFNGNLGTVLRGYAVEISRAFDPGTYIISGQDRSILLHEYFIDEQLISGGEPVDYWISYIAGLAGFDVEFQSSSPNAFVPPESAMGMQTAAEVILSLERQAAYYIKYDASVDKLVVFRLGTSEPVMTITTDDATAIQQAIGTENTRNVVKIYGGYRFDFITGLSEQIFTKSVANVPELLVDKAVVIANPYIKNFTSAYIVANRILDVVSTLDDVQTYVLEGFFPDRSVGESIYVDVNFGNLDIGGNQLITTIEAIVDKSNGVTTTITTGEKCPRLSVQLPIPPILVATDQDGVGISWNGGDSFVPSNIGLVSDADKFAWSIAANQYSQQMVLTSGGIFRRFGTGGIWQLVSTLEDPVNTANDSPAITIANLSLDKVVDHPIRQGTFHILANTSGALTPARAWIYTTPNFGATWESKQLYVEKVPSGITWAVTGLDIETSPVNDMYCLVHGTVYGTGAYFGKRTSTNPQTWNIYTWDRNNAPSVKHTITMTGSQQTTFKIFSVPGSRRYAVAIVTRKGTLTTAKPSFAIAITSDNGDTWTNIYNAQVTANWPSFPGFTSVNVKGAEVLFNYYSTPIGINLHFPINGYAIDSLGFDGTCYHLEEHHYEGAGFNININNGVVTISTQEYTQTWDFDWFTKETIFNALGYFPDPPIPVKGEKYAADVEITYTWVGPDPGLECVGETYPPDGDKIEVIVPIYTANPADDHGYNSGTYSVPAGYTLGIGEGYDSTYYYGILISDGTVMFLANGSVGAGYDVNLSNILLGPETRITAITDVEIMEDI